MNSKTVKQRRAVYILLGVLVSVLQTFPLWLAEYRRFSGSDAIKATLGTVIVTALVFYALAGQKHDWLTALHRYIQTNRLYMPKASCLLMVSLCLMFGLCGFLLRAANDSVMNWISVCRRVFLLLSALYLIARGLPDKAELSKALTWRIVQSLLLCVFSKIAFGGFAAAFYVTAFYALGDLLALRSVPGAKRSAGLWLKTLAGCALPLLICVAAAIGWKAVFSPEVLDWQVRMVMQTAPKCYGLGMLCTAIQQSGETGYLLLSAYGLLPLLAAVLLLTAGSSLLDRLQTEAVGLMALMFAFVVLCTLVQVLLDAELIMRILPFVTFEAVLLTALPAQSVLTGGREETDNA